jgi:hypothetical protein
MVQAGRGAPGQKTLAKVLNSGVPGHLPYTPLLSSLCGSPQALLEPTEAAVLLWALWNQGPG